MQTMPFEASQVFCGYRLDRRLGSGQFGEVWSAWDGAKDRTIALKILKEGFRPDDVDRFKKEFQVLTTLHHPHLAHVYQFGHDALSDHYFFASEYCPGRPLFAATEGKPIADIEEIFVQLLAALDYVHGQGLVHRDLKSDNVLCEDRDGRPYVKLVDFGLAARRQSLPEGMAGTLAYMAPEMLTANAARDHRVDLYSLGMLALKILARRWPFDVRNVEAVVEWQLRGVLPEDFWPDIPAYLKETVEKFLRKTPSERFSSARVALHFMNLGTGGRFRAIEDSFGQEIPAIGPFVEREESFRQCLSAFESDSDVVFYVTGEPGIGKTRFLEELRFLLELRDMRVLGLTCLPNQPTWPRLAEMLGITMGGIGGREDSPPDSSRTSGFAGGGENAESAWKVLERVEALTAASRRRPFCLILDDLPSAEEEFRELIRQVARRRLPLFIVAACEESPEGVEIKLERFGREAVRAYVSHLLGDSDRLESVVNFLFDYSGGLPLLVVEGLRYLAPYYFRGETLEGRLAAPGMSHLYRDKLQSLSDEERKLVEILALLRRAADFSELGRFLGEPTDRVWEIARGPIRARLLMEDARLCISSQALGLDLAQVIEAERRRALHRKIAEGLTAEGGVGREEEVADHWKAAGESAHASAFYRLASEEWRKEGQISRAVRCSGEALSLAKSGTPEALDLALEAAQLLVLKGDYDEANRLLETDKIPPSAKVWEIRGTIAFKRRQWDAALEAYDKGRETAEDEKDEVDRVLFLNSLANVRLQKGEREEAKRLFLQAAEAEGRLPSERRGRIGNNNLGLVLGLEGRIDEAVRVIRDRIAVLAPDRLPDKISHLQVLGFVFLQASRFQEASEALRQAVALSEKSGVYHAYLPLLRNLATALMKEARYAEALAALKKIAAYEEGQDSKRDLAYNLLRQAGAYLILGMEEAAREGFRKGRELARASGDASLEGWFTLMDGYCEREFGDPDSARRLFEKLSAQSKNSGDAVLSAWSLYASSDLAWERGEAEEAERLASSVEVPQGDEDLAIRLEHLCAKMKIERGELESAGDLLDGLESRCVRGRFLETLWEIYQTRALLRARQGNSEEAERSLEKGIDIVRDISRALPEEYRERYLNKTSRKRLWESRKEVGRLMNETSNGKAEESLLEMSHRIASERDQLARDLERTRRELLEKEEKIEVLVSQVSLSPRRTIYPYEKIVGRSKRMEEVLKVLDKVTNANVPLFILGETGTGKELVARALHQNGRRKNALFLAINCSAFTETILESELFGCIKGAFTGADRDRKGLFEEASGGTLFLDEIADMSLGMQAKVLRVLQEQEVMRVGGRTPIKIDIRLVSAANKDLKKLVREGKFREDLFFRIAGILLELPPLRERREDIPLLAKHFMEKIRKENNLKPLKLGREAMNRLVSYNWPGNIRELEQCLTNACLMAEEGAIRPEHLLLHKDLYKERPSSAKAMEGEAHVIAVDLDKKMEDYEREIILKTLEFCGGNKSEAARRLGLSRLTMHKKTKAYDLYK